MSAVIVSIAIGYQAETRRCADLDQSQGLREIREDRQQRRASSGFIGLGRAVDHDRSNGVLILSKNATELAPAGGGPEQKACGGKQQVRLSLLLWARQQKGDHQNIGCHTSCKLVIKGRSIAGFFIGEPEICGGDAGLLDWSMLVALNGNSSAYRRNRKPAASISEAAIRLSIINRHHFGIARVEVSTGIGGAVEFGV